jgi:hypothetical protein
MMAKIMKEPELAAAMQKPKVMQAIMVGSLFSPAFFFRLSFFTRPVFVLFWPLFLRASSLRWLLLALFPLSRQESDQTEERKLEENHEKKKNSPSSLF